MSALGVGKVVKTIAKFEQNIVRVVKEGTDLLTNPNATADDWTKWDEDCKNVFKSGEQDISNEAISQAKEGASKRLLGQGLSKVDVDRITSNVMKKIMDNAEKVRKTIPKVEAVAKLGWLKFVGVISVGFAALTTFSMFSHDQATDYSRSAVTALNRIDQEQRIMIENSEALRMITNLTALTAPLSAPSSAQQRAPVASLPPPVAAIAAAPAIVEIHTPTETNTITTTVGQVYGTAPRSVQRVMSTPPTPITHCYDGTESNCGALTPGWRPPPEEPVHKCWTTASEMASIRVCY